MIESIPGHDKWLDPPKDIIHRKDCPRHGDHEYFDPDAECICLELADADEEDMQAQYE